MKRPGVDHRQLLGVFLIIIGAIVLLMAFCRNN